MYEMYFINQVLKEAQAKRNHSAPPILHGEDFASYAITITKATIKAVFSLRLLLMCRKICTVLKNKLS